MKTAYIVASYPITKDPDPIYLLSFKLDSKLVGDKRLFSSICDGKFEIFEIQIPDDYKKDTINRSDIISYKVVWQFIFLNLILGVILFIVLNI